MIADQGMKMKAAQQAEDVAAGWYVALGWTCWEGSLWCLLGRLATGP